MSRRRLFPILLVTVLAMLAPLLSPTAASATPGHHVDVTTFQDGTDIWSPDSLVQTADGSIWYVMYEVGRIGRLDPVTGEATVYGTNADALTSPGDMVLLPDGHLWFTISSGLVDFDPATGDFDKYADPDHVLQDPSGMALGPDGALWIVAGGDGTESVVSRFDTVAHEFTNHQHDHLYWPEDIVVGADGNLWIANSGDEVIAKLTTGGTFTFFPGPANTPYAWDLVSGPDGAIWYTSPTTARIGRVTTGGAFTSYPTTGITEPRGLFVGPDRHLWMSALDQDGIGRMDIRSHLVTKLVGDPEEFANMSSLMFAGDQVWVTIGADHQLGRFGLPHCGRGVANVIRAFGDQPSNRPDAIAGVSGDDTIDALGGNDVVCAGTGNDTVEGGEGDDVLHGEIGADTLSGGPGIDLVDGGPSRGDHCDGGPARDAASGCETAKNI